MKIIYVFLLIITSTTIASDKQKVNAEIDFKLNDVFAVSKDTVFAVGRSNQLLYTENGGTEWRRRPVDNAINNYYFSSVFFIDNEIGWIAASNENIYKTIDGGKSWLKSTIPRMGQDIIFLDVFFVDQQYGWACGREAFPSGLVTYDRGIVICTSDGGESWKRKEIDPFTTSFQTRLRKVFFQDSQNGWITGEQSDPEAKGLILRTEDGGDTWQSKDTEYLKNATALFLLNSDFGWITGTRLENPQQGTCTLKTINGGDSWVEYDMSSSERISDLTFFMPEFGIASTYEGQILSTSDSGKTWQEKFTFETGLNAMHFADEQNGWTVGGFYYSGDYIGTILKTEDGGESWFSQDNNVYIDAEEKLPSKFALFQNYPNPFNPSTTIPYQLAQPGQVKLEIFNTIGQKIRTLVNEVQGSGKHTAIWKGLNEQWQAVSSGVYYYSIKSGEFHEMRKMVLLR